MPERTILAVGDVAVLTCDFSGDPKPSVTWSKNGNTSIPRAHFGSDGRTLFIKDVQPGDSGLYECKAVNDFGESNTNTTLIVAGKLYYLYKGLYQVMYNRLQVMCYFGKFRHFTFYLYCIHFTFYLYCI